MSEIEEKKGLLRVMDENGNRYILYPETKMELVEGLTDFTNTMSRLITDAMMTSGQAINTANVAKNTADAADDTAARAYSTANEAKGDVAAAQAAVNGALVVANNANATANEAKTTAETALDEANSKADANHTHNYAGSSSAGGAATTALACTGNAATATNSTKWGGYQIRVGEYTSGKAGYITFSTV